MRVNSWSVVRILVGFCILAVVSLNAQVLHDRGRYTPFPPGASPVEDHLHVGDASTTTLQMVSVNPADQIPLTVRPSKLPPQLRRQFEQVKREYNAIARDRRGLEAEEQKAYDAAVERLQLHVKENIGLKLSAADFALDFDSPLLLSWKLAKVVLEDYKAFQKFKEGIHSNDWSDYREGVRDGVMTALGFAQEALKKSGAEAAESVAEQVLNGFGAAILARSRCLAGDNRRRRTY